MDSINSILIKLKSCKRLGLRTILLRYLFLTLGLMLVNILIYRIWFRMQSVRDCEGAVIEIVESSIWIKGGKVRMSWPIFELAGDCKGREFLFNEEQSYPSGFFHCWEKGDVVNMQLHQDGFWYVSNSIDAWLPFQFFVWVGLISLVLLMLFLKWLDESVEEPIERR